MSIDHLTDYSSPTFLKKAKEILESDGFISNAHQFTPYGPTIVKHIDDITASLRKMGFSYELKTGQLRNDYGSLTYYVYLPSKLGNEHAAKKHVEAWVTKLHQDDEDDEVGNG